LISNIPGYLDRIRTDLIPFLETRFDVELPQTLDGIVVKIKTALNEANFSMKSLSPLGNVLGQAFTSIFSVIMFALNLVLVPVFTFYLLLEFPDWIEFLDSLVPRPFHGVVQNYSRSFNTIVSSFVRGQVTVCLILAVLYSLGLWISGVPYWLVIGMFAGTIAFIPYLGFIGGILPGIILAYATHGDLYHPITVVIAFIVVQGIESNIITPKIIGESVGLNPIAVMLALILAGSFLGFLGLLIAVPLAAVVKVFFEDFISYYKSSSIYKGEESAS
jgi:predicted PurR-regulated permease PerM